MLLFFIVVQTFVGFLIGKGKGRPVLGIALGLTLGFIGCAILALIPAVKAPAAQAPSKW